jgi:hypothetical protein
LDLPVIRSGVQDVLRVLLNSLGELPHACATEHRHNNRSAVEGRMAKHCSALYGAIMGTIEVNVRLFPNNRAGPAGGGIGPLG